MINDLKKNKIINNKNSTIIKEQLNMNLLSVIFRFNIGNNTLYIIPPSLETKNYFLIYCQTNHDTKTHKKNITLNSKLTNLLPLCRTSQFLLSLHLN